MDYAAPAIPSASVQETLRQFYKLRTENIEQIKLQETKALSEDDGRTWIVHYE